MKVSPFPRARLHTLYFLHGIRDMAPVFLDTDIDMSSVRAHRDDARRSGRRYSTVSYVLHAAGRVLVRHPEANAALRGRLWPRIARYPFVNGKFTLDKTLDGRRVVLSSVIPDLQRASLEEIQRQVDHFRDGDPDDMPEFAKLRKLHRAPRPLGALAFALAGRSLRGRPALLGTLAVTSLGHRPVDGFHSTGGTTVTLGLGRTADRPVVRDERITVAPVMRLSLAFDHRVIDGAEAADVLAELKETLENFHEDGPQEGPEPASDTGAHASPQSIGRP
uniref:Putative acyltransferase n=1 Tax=Streptomyces versipellis TaxID=67375 RepID=A0A0B6VLR2_9ACTN|nr:putative acyltransferase [Streptomyces versipellis]